MKKAQVHKSINNLYTAFCPEDGVTYTLRIKGKTLKLDEYEYNPVAVGDWLEFTPYSPSEGLATARLPRTSAFTRWNIKLEKNQTIAANMDQVAIVTSSSEPPFRPRFLDRALSCAKGCPVFIVMNKCDLLLTEYEFERWALYHKLGYKIIAVSAATGENLDDLVKLLEGKVTAFVGQSGVGKSSLVNALVRPEKLQTTNSISEKYQRGRHTTNHSLWLEGNGITLIDTPGVRELLTPLEDERLIQESFPEFARHAENCAYGSDCLHDSEPGCTVREAVEEGGIDSDRYSSYLGMLESVRGRKPEYLRDRFRKNKQ